MINRSQRSNVQVHAKAQHQFVMMNAKCISSMVALTFTIQFIGGQLQCLSAEHATAGYSEHFVKAEYVESFLDIASQANSSECRIRLTIINTSDLGLSLFQAHGVSDGRKVDIAPPSVRQGGAETSRYSCLSDSSH